MKKTSKRVEACLKNAKSFGSMSRTPMPRPTVFRDKTKYDRKRSKQAVLRYGY